MTMNEFDKLKVGDTIYYITDYNSIGESKVEEKKVINGHQILSFYPDEKVETESSLFLYSYAWEGFVVRFHYENVFLTKEKAEEKIEKIKATPRKFTKELPWY